MDEIIKKFGAAYEFIYAHCERIPEALIVAGEFIIEQEPAFVQALAEARGDFISSDREVAALALALGFKL